MIKIRIDAEIQGDQDVANLRSLGHALAGFGVHQIEVLEPVIVRGTIEQPSPIEANMEGTLGAPETTKEVAKRVRKAATKTETEAPQAEAPQAEAPQAEAPQAEAPQAEAPQAEAPQAEAPQAEAPQAEAPQAEAPQAEAPQAEAPANGVTEQMVRLAVQDAIKAGKTELVKGVIMDLGAKNVSGIPAEKYAEAYDKIKAL